MFFCDECLPTDPDPYREAAIAALGAVIGALLTLVIVQARSSPAAAASLSAAPPLAQPLAAKKVGSGRRASLKVLPTSVSPETLQALVEARRSVQPKDYTGAVLPEWQVRAILAAAPWAPNHGNTEPWRFQVFAGERKRVLLDSTLAWYRAQPAAFWKQNFVLLSTGQPEFADYAAFAAYYEKAAVDKWGKASHLIAVCVRRQRAEDKPGKKVHPEWEETCAVACAVQNMHLLATTLRVGAYWSSWYAHYTKAPEMTAELGLQPEEGDRCLGVFVLGAISPELSSRGTRMGVDEVARWM